ncbi:TIGR03667 family PPOX class F420-dependent oxidoreductase [Actinomadura kijaniata]|uniref:PPOX class probable F420-dependent enzyme n=1 Tax=Actinomadura namibiensis TaxID=182080 RepID=A0A7W3QND3_ACTNM|nr:TIGR03667 family PPOX class F420-dependent oxidoreductase [Actinomadura namibiensis]MBA8953459.1 PPOX class probable F420-dependent enzyme [Actinomadura namibiensis]
MDNDTIPESTDLGRRAHRRLRTEPVVWLTTVGRDGTPQPNPVWFVWEDDAEGGAVLTYTQADAHRLAHIRRSPRVSLHFDSNGQGGDIVVLTGHAQILTDHPAASEHPPYLDKYREGIARLSGTPEAFAARYSVPVRIRPTKLRGF